MRHVLRSILCVALFVMLSQSLGCGRQVLREENHDLREQNEGLKRQLDEANSELRETKIQLDRSQADLAAERARH